MRHLGTPLVLAVILSSMNVEAQATTAFEDNKLNFQTCDGKKLTARWRENNFHLSIPGKTLEPEAPELNYIGWDGECRSLRVDAKGQFQHKKGDASDSNRHINYISWDGTKWSATRAGTGFLQILITEKGAPTDTQLQDAATWLKRHKANSRAANTLADELTAGESGK